MTAPFVSEVGNATEARLLLSSDARPLAVPRIFQVSCVLLISRGLQISWQVLNQSWASHSGPPPLGRQRN